MQIEYHPKLENELREIINYYNRCSLGLGEEFLDEFESQIMKISGNPYQWLVLKSTIRRSLMSRFPYVIYFRIVDENTLRITVVKHQKRHPKVGLHRV
ncbi:MAG: type II toxin-antitoxin system RelE/ParE family toxin [Campylobacterales bacterium]|nr:type II toxin-antitoxin system RelE/ParE family toxin [Campylobacterales bacterium]